MLDEKLLEEVAEYNADKNAEELADILEVVYAIAKNKGILEEDLKEMLGFANAAAALITTRKGALRVMPSVEEINKITKIPGRTIYYKKKQIKKTEN